MFHGNYQTARNATNVLKYCKKDGDFIFDGVDTVGKDGVWKHAIELAAKGEVDAARLYLIEQKPRDVVMNGDRMLNNLRLLQPPPPPYAIPDGHSKYLPLPRDLSEGVEVLGKKALVVHGPPGLGKTCWARSLGSHRFVTHLDDLKGVDFKAGDLLIFDDMSFAHLPYESCISIVDCEQERSIHARYANIRLPAGLRKIFLTNREPRDLFADPDSLGGVERRVHEVYFGSKLY